MGECGLPICLIADVSRVAEIRHLAALDASLRFVALTPRFKETLEDEAFAAALLEDYCPEFDWDSINRLLMAPWSGADAPIFADAWSHFLISEANVPYLIGRAVRRLLETSQPSHLTILSSPGTSGLWLAVLGEAERLGIRGDIL